jgi:predicted PhzF superfamily epimerase YddE/YHI9
MAILHLLRVFCNESGEGGNPLAVFLDGSQVPPERRQEVAADLGLSETVFVDDAERGVLRIFTPAAEIEFAGHPTVGTAWLLRATGRPVESLHVPAGELPVRYEGEVSVIAGRPEWAPEFEWEQLGSAEEVEGLDGPPRDHDLIGVWAWIDEDAGLVRSRVFPRRFGIEEDEATGAASVRLCGLLGRAIDIRQGRGSVIGVRPAKDGYVELSGRSVLDEEREYQPARSGRSRGRASRGSAGGSPRPSRTSRRARSS